MVRATFAARVTILEQKVERLEQLPQQIDALASQILQFREDVRLELSGLRADMRAGAEETRRGLRDEIRAGDEETRRVLRDEIRAGDEETRRVLREEIRSGDEETRQLMRVLHEDLIGRIALLNEARKGPKRHTNTPP